MHYIGQICPNMILNKLYSKNFNTVTIYVPSCHFKLLCIKNYKMAVQILPIWKYEKWQKNKQTNHKSSLHNNTWQTDGKLRLFTNNLPFLWAINLTTAEIWSLSHWVELWFVNESVSFVNNLLKRTVHSMYQFSSSTHCTQHATVVLEVTYFYCHFFVVGFCCVLKRTMWRR